MHNSLKTLAAAVLAACALPASAATVYDKDGTTLDFFGRVSAMFMNQAATRSGNAHSFYGKSASPDNTLASVVRMGMAGRTRVSDQVYAIGMFEWQTPINSSEESTSMNGRYAFAGIDAQSYGTLIAGRGDGAYAAVAAATDIYSYLDTKSNDYWLFGDNVSGQIMYSLSAMGWDLRLSMQLAEDEVNNLFNVDSGYAFSVSTRLRNGISIAYGASYTDFSYEGEPGIQNAFFGEMYQRALGDSGTDPAAFGLTHHPSYKVNKGIAISYGTLGDGFYAAALYNVTRYKGLPHHIYDYELALSYTFDNGIELNGGYSMQQYRDHSVIEDLNCGVAFRPSPSFKLFVEAQLDMSASPERLYPDFYIKEKALGQNRFVIGAEYDF